MATVTGFARDAAVAIDAVFDCLASGRRRRLLGLVYEGAPDPTSREELAAAIVAQERGKPQDEVTSEERQRALIDLHHVHLPKLADAGLVERNADDTVATTDHPAFRDPGIREIVESRETGDARSLDALFEALADARRRTVLDVLSHQYQEIRTETLAREVAASETGTAEREVTVAETEQRLVSLRHNHLPRLREAGLIEYEDDEQTVAYEGHPELRVQWMHSQLGDDFRKSLTDDPKEGDMWAIEGRENVVSYGQSLCDEADEELFMLFTTTGLLESGCFTRIADATERGVDVYLGTHDPIVREFVREHAPEVTLWEPQVDWLNFPVDEGKVGRLVFADREAIMLGTLGEKDGDGVHAERAVVGDGADNAFVVLMRQMLSSHLAQFEEQSVQPELPF